MTDNKDFPSNGLSLKTASLEDLEGANALPDETHGLWRCCGCGGTKMWRPSLDGTAPIISQIQDIAAGSAPVVARRDYMDTPHYRVNKFVATLRVMDGSRNTRGEICG